MCRRRPGPRCSDHAKQYLAKAKARLRRLQQEEPTPATLAKIERAEAAVRANEASYRNTPAYQSSLEERHQNLVERIERDGGTWKPSTQKRRDRERRELERRIEYAKRSRLGSRAAARGQNSHTTTGIKGVASMATLASYANAEAVVAAGRGDANVRDQRGKMRPAAMVAADAQKMREQYGPAWENAMDELKRNGLVLPTSAENYETTYHRGLEPQFSIAPKNRMTGSFTTRSGKVSMTPVGEQYVSRTRIHDHNGITHEASYSMSVTQGDDGKWYVSTSIRGASALYGNNAAQDSMTINARGSLLSSGARQWSTRRAIACESREAAEAELRRKITVMESRDDGVSDPMMAVVVSRFGTASMNRAIRQGKPLSPFNLDGGKNATQTAGTGRIVDFEKIRAEREAREKAEKKAKSAASQSKPKGRKQK